MYNLQESRKRSKNLMNDFTKELKTKNTQELRSYMNQRFNAGWNMILDSMSQYRAFIENNRENTRDRLIEAIMLELCAFAGGGDIQQHFKLPDTIVAKYLEEVQAGKTVYFSICRSCGYPFLPNRVFTKCPICNGACQWW